MTIEQIHINNGIKSIASQDVINDVVLYGYYGGILPSEVVVGSYKQAAEENNSDINLKILPRDTTGNIISYIDNTKNKNKLVINLLSKKFETRSVKYAVDYNFEEFYSNSQVVDQQEQLIETLQQNVNILLSNIDAKNIELNNLKLLDTQKSKSLVDAQNTINGLVNQATKIADDLAKIMQDNVKSSNAAVKDLTDSVKADASNKQKEIDSLKNQIDKLKEDVNKVNTKPPVASSSNTTTNTTTVTLPATSSILTSSSGSNTPNPIITTTGNINQSSLVTQVTAAIANNKPSPTEQIIVSKEVTRSEGILTKTNNLLVEIAIGQWYKYLKEEPSLYAVFDRREVTHRLMLKGNSYNSNGDFIGQAVNKLTDGDIEYLLKLLEKYWINVPYNNVYSKGIPYTDAEQKEFEKKYPFLTGVRQYSPGPKHFLYNVNIFNDDRIKADKYKYVKF